MPIKLSPPVEKEFILAKTDQLYGNDGSEPTMIRVRQASRGINELRDQRQMTMTQVIDSSRPQEIMYRDFVTMKSLYRYEVFLTLSDCNILDSDGKPLFRFSVAGNRRVLDMSEANFNDAWNQLDEVVALEIIDFVHEVNISWKNQGEAS